MRAVSLKRSANRITNEEGRSRARSTRGTKTITPVPGRTHAGGTTERTQQCVTSWPKKERPEQQTPTAREDAGSGAGAQTAPVKRINGTNQKQITHKSSRAFEESWPSESRRNNATTGREQRERGNEERRGNDARINARGAVFSKKSLQRLYRNDDDVSSTTREIKKKHARNNNGLLYGCRGKH